MLFYCGAREDSWSPSDSKIKSVSPKGNQPWIFTGRTDAEVEAPIHWSPEKSWLTGKDPDAGKGWGQKEMRATEDEMAGWHHQLNGHECEQTMGDTEGQGSLSSCSPWGRKKSDRTKRLNSNSSSNHTFILMAEIKNSNTKCWWGWNTTTLLNIVVGLPEWPLENSSATKVKHTLNI